MRAELNTGEIVPLPKDCTCIDHNDPHWVYEDRLWRDANRRLLTDTPPEKSFYALYGCAIEEKARIEQKLRDMRRRGIVRLIAEPSDEPTDLQRAEIARRTRELQGPQPDTSPYANRATGVRRTAKERI